MRILAFILGGLLGVMLLGGGVLYYLFSGEMEQAPIASPSSIGLPGGPRFTEVTRAPGTFLIKGTIELPASVAHLAKDGYLEIVVSHGDYSAIPPKWVPVAGTVIAADLKFPVQVELEIPKAEMDSTPMGGVGEELAVTAYYCKGDVAAGCLKNINYVLRRRKQVVSLGRAKSLKEAMNGRREVDIGKLALTQAYERTEKEKCIGGKNLIAGTAELTPKAQAKVRQAGGWMLSAGSLMERFPKTYVAMLGAGTSSAKFSFEGLEENSGYHYMYAAPCKEGKSRDACQREFQEHRRKGGRQELLVAYSAHEVAYCGDTNVKLYVFTPEDRGDQSLPREVQENLENEQIN